MDWRRLADAFRARFRAIVGRRRAERDLHEELSFHVAMQTQANVRAGIDQTEAERRARAALGGLEPTKERVREVRPLRAIEQSMQDLQYAL